MYIFQIVIQVGDEKDGVVLVRTGANDKKYACPIKYLKEIWTQDKRALENQA